MLSYRIQYSPLRLIFKCLDFLVQRLFKGGAVELKYYKKSFETIILG